MRKQVLFREDNEPTETSKTTVH